MAVFHNHTTACLIMHCVSDCLPVSPCSTSIYMEGPHEHSEIMSNLTSSTITSALIGSAVTSSISTAITFIIVQSFMIDYIWCQVCLVIPCVLCFEWPTVKNVFNNDLWIKWLLTSVHMLTKMFASTELINVLVNIYCILLLKL